MIIPELICPNCQSVSLIPCIGKEYNKAYLFYKDATIKCYYCEYEQKIATVLTRYKVD